MYIAGVRNLPFVLHACYVAPKKRKILQRNMIREDDDENKLAENGQKTNMYRHSVPSEHPDQAGQSLLPLLDVNVNI